MSEIVLNEVLWVENMMLDRSLGKKPSETIRRIAQYYHEVEGLKRKKDIEMKIKEYIIRCDPYASIVKWEDAVSKIVSYAMKHKMLNINGVTISHEEYQSIMAIKSKQEQRLCFTLLCLAKYWNSVNPNNNNWVNTKDSDIMRMANVNTSVRKQSEMLHNIADLGLIQFSKKIDNTNIQVCFADVDYSGDAYMTVSDFRNLGYQFMREIKPTDYYTCSVCGVIEKKRIRSPKDENRGRIRHICRRCSCL